MLRWSIRTLPIGRQPHTNVCDSSRGELGEFRSKGRGALKVVIVTVASSRMPRTLKDDVATILARLASGLLACPYRDDGAERPSNDANISIVSLGFRTRVTLVLLHGWFIRKGLPATLGSLSLLRAYIHYPTSGLSLPCPRPARWSTHIVPVRLCPIGDGVVEIANEMPSYATSSTRARSREAISEAWLSKAR